MAFSNTPELSTYSTVEIDLLKVNQSRDVSTNKDPNLINCYPEFTFNKLTNQQDVNIRKRPGYTTYISAPFGTVARGIYYWKDQDKLFYAVDRDMHVYTASTGSIFTTISNFFSVSSGTGPVGFVEFLYESGEVRLVVVDGIQIRTISTILSVVTGVDPDQPGTPSTGTFLPIPIFLNGYLLIIKTDTADIYNSDSNNPLSFTSTGFINSEIEPDQLKSIAKLNNYIVVLGSSSIEYFYDASIATGSPLQRNEVPVKTIGYVTGLAQQSNRVYFVGTEKNGSVDVYVLEDLKISSLGNPGTKRYLSSYSLNYATNLLGSIVSCKGANWYVLSDAVRTDVLDLESQLWSQWANGATSVFPIKHSTSFASITGTRSIFVLSTSLTIFAFDQSVYQDNGTNFTVTIVTENEKFGTLLWKNMDKFIINADNPVSSQLINVQWTDDDYQSYNTAQTIDLFQSLPCIYQLGGFRERAFKLSYTGALPLRISKIECEINKGNS